MIYTTFGFVYDFLYLYLMKSEFRKSLEEQDKLGVSETFEARIRGALSPYDTLICLLKEEDIDKDTLLELLRGFNEVNDKCLEQIKELLKNSELDREFLKKSLSLK